MKLFFHQLQKRSAESLKRFNISFIMSILLFSILAYIICAKTSDSVYDYVTASLICTTIFSALWQIIIEIQYTLSKIPARFRYMPVAVFGIVLFILFCITDNIGYVSLYTVGISIALLSFIFFLLSHQSRSGEAVFNQLFCGFLKAAALTLLVSFSLMICLAALHLLIIDLTFPAYAVVFDFAVVIIGTNVFLAFIPIVTEKAKPSFLLYKILQWVILPIYAFLILILYAYILMICKNGSMPVGQMNWFASLAVFVYVFYYMTCRQCTTMPGIVFFLKWGGIMLLPIITVQLLGVYIRYEAFGLTDVRYASMICTGFGIIVVLNGLFRHSLQKLFLLSALFSIIFTVTPLNIFDLPYKEQMTRIETILTEKKMLQNEIIITSDELSARDKEIIASAYDYMRSQNKLQIQQTCTKAALILNSLVIQKIAAEKGNFLLWSFTNSSQAVPIAGYQTMYILDTTTENGYITVPVSNGMTKTFYIADYADTLCRNIASPDQSVAGNHDIRVPGMQLTLDNNHLLYLQWLHIRKIKDNHSRIALSGYVLEK